MSTESPLGEYFFNPWAIPYFIAAIMSLVIIIILFYRAERTTSIQLFTSAQICNLIVSLTAFFATCVEEGHSNLWNFWMQINSLVSLFTVVFFLHFSYTYLYDSNFLQNKSLLFLYLIPPIVFILRFLFYFQDIHETDQSYYGHYDIKFNEVQNFIYWSYYLLLAVFMIFTAANFVRMYRSNDENLKKISGYFILAAAIPFVAITIVLLLDFISDDRILKFELTLTSTVIVNIIIAYGILKKNLFDINEILRSKVIPYIITNFLLTWVLVLVKETVNHIFAETFELANEFSMVIVLLFFVPIHDLTHMLTHKLLPTPDISNTPNSHH